MIRLDIFNINEFLKTVNNCAGAVNILEPDGKKVNICRREDPQLELRRRHQENYKRLRLALDIPNPQDYLRIVYFSIGDC